MLRKTRSVRRLARSFITNKQTDWQNLSTFEKFNFCINKYIHFFRVVLRDVLHWYYPSKCWWNKVLVELGTLGKAPCRLAIIILFPLCLHTMNTIPKKIILYSKHFIYCILFLLFFQKVHTFSTFFYAR